MAIYKKAFTSTEGSSPNVYYVTDTTAERPSIGLSIGDSCFCKDTGKFYIATDRICTTTCKVQFNSKGSSGTITTTIAAA